MPLAAWRENSSRHVASLRRIRLLFFIAPVSSTITGRDYPQWTDLRKYVAELPVTLARLCLTYRRSIAAADGSVHWQSAIRAKSLPLTIPLALHHGHCAHEGQFMKYEQQSKTSGLSDVQTLRKRTGSSSRPAESSESSTVQRFVPVKRRSLRKPNAWVRRGRKGPMPRYQSRDRPIDELISTLNRPTTGSFGGRGHARR